MLFVRTKDGYYVDLREIEDLGFWALSVYGSAKRWKKFPTEAGDTYIEVQHYFPEKDFDTAFTLGELFVYAKFPKEMSEQSIEI